ncbi:MAG: hypothetical protein IJT97_04430 [Bacteroidaceae bacterium]|nr:hypothetical protein [Bacteroidaceae bacterium]
MLIGPNGNSIFLLTAGHSEYYSLHGTNLTGFYWSSSLTESNPLDAWSRQGQAPKSVYPLHPERSHP